MKKLIIILILLALARAAPAKQKINLTASGTTCAVTSCVSVGVDPPQGGATFTLVFPPLLVTTVGASILAVSFVIMDGESDWLEGAALLGLYVVVAASFWWG